MPRCQQAREAPAVATLLSPTPLASVAAASGQGGGSAVAEDNAFGNRLKRLRETAGLTQAQLAERAGMHRFGVAKLERGERQPSWATVQTLARALGVRCTAFED